MPGRQIGKLSIRVIPDSTRFREEMQALVDEAEARYKIHVPVEVDTEEARAQIERFAREEADRKVHVGVDLNTGDASERLALLARNRTSVIRVFVDTTNFTKAATAVKALSGLRLVGDVFTEIRDKLLTLDEAVPKISRIALGASTLVSSLLSSAAGLITVGGDLLQVFNLFALGPAVFTGLATGIFALIVALGDASNQLSSLAPAWANLKGIITDNFWAQAQGPILNFVNGILPQLDAGFAQVATSLGRQIGAVATAFGNAFSGGVLQSWLSSIAGSMDILTKGAQSVASGFVTLGTVGMTYMARLAEFLVRVADGFNNWIQASAKSGALAGYIEAGITSVKLFASSLASAASILAGLNRAAEAAGAGGLYSLATALAAVASTVNSGVFQTALTTILVGAGKAMSSLGAGLSDLVRTFGALAPQIGQALAIAGATVGAFISGVASALNQPAIKQGLVDLFSGIQRGVAGLVTALPTVGRVIGLLGTAVGTLAAQFGPLLAAVKNTFGPVLEALIPIATNLAVVFSSVLTAAIRALQGPLTALAGFISSNQGVFTVLAGAALILGAALGTVISIVVSLVETFAPLVLALGGVEATIGLIGSAFAALTGPVGIAIAAIVGIGVALTAFFTQTELGRAIVAGFASYLSTAFTNAVNFLTPIFTAIAGFVGTLISSFQAGFAQVASVVNGFLAFFQSNVLPVFQPVFDGIVAGLTGFVTSVVAGFQAVSTAVAAVIAFFQSNVAPVLADVFTFIATKVQEFATFLETAWTAIQPAVQPLVDFFVNVVGPQIGTVLQVLGVALGVLAGIIAVVFIAPLALAAAAVLAFIAVVVGIVTAITAVASGVGTALTFVQGLFTSVFTAIGQIVIAAIGVVVSAVNSGSATVRAVWQAALTAISAVTSAVWAAIVATVTVAVNAVRAVVTSVIAAVSAVWSANWNTIRSVVSAAWAAINGIVSAAMGTVRSVISGGMAAVSGSWSSIWATIRSTVSSAWAGIQGIISSILSGIRGMVSSVVGTLSGLPGQIRGVFAGAASWLFSAGEAIVQGLINGIKAMIGAAVAAAASLMSAVSKLMPHSPAQEGPFSGRGWTLYSGQAIGEALATGMESTTGRVRSAAMSMLSSARPDGFDVASSATGIQVNRGSGDSIVVQGNVGYDPARIASEIALKKQQARLRAGFTKVAYA